jgi:hypothetical protein
MLCWRHFCTYIIYVKLIIKCPRGCLPISVVPSYPIPIQVTSVFIVMGWFSRVGLSGFSAWAFLQAVILANQDSASEKDGLIF